tara:strand:- start:70 stop:537 length:468 start_codon:yes stop_codon:yes gene_type:complete
MTASFVGNSGNRRAFLKVDSIEKLTRKAVRSALYISGIGLKRNANTEILKKPKGGRTYIRKDRAGRKRRHVASAPGETHANMSGTLRRSLGFKVGGRDQLEFGYGVENVPAPDYAEPVEFGSAKMAARPTIQNAIKSERRNIINNIEHEVIRAMK